MPKEVFGDDYVFLPKSELLSFEEITRLAEKIDSLVVQKIRLTGGEPLMRKDLEQLIDKLTKIQGIDDIALTSNGFLLPRKAQALKDAGLQRVNISLDAIEDNVFKKVNGRNVGTLPALKGIEAAQKAGLKVKVNTVVKKGMNESQIVPLARYFKDKDVILRFIEFMDVGNHNNWDLNNVITKKQKVKTINKEMPHERRSEK